MTGKDDTMMVATESFVDSDGDHYTKDTTRATARFVAKKGWEHLFKPLEAHHDNVEAATQAPGEKRR